MKLKIKTERETEREGHELRESDTRLQLKNKEKDIKKDSQLV